MTKEFVNKWSLKKVDMESCVYDTRFTNREIFLLDYFL